MKRKKKRGRRLIYLLKNGLKSSSDFIRGIFQFYIFPNEPFLKRHATAVNNFLSKYIELHNTFQQSTGSIFSIFKKINYARMAGDAYFLFEQLRDERNEIEKLKNEASNPKDKEFAEILFLYTKSLTETDHLLFMLLHALKEKAEGGKLSMSEHMENHFEQPYDLIFKMKESFKLLLIVLMLS